MMRAQDDRLREAITAALTAGGPQLVLLVGGSSVGKTRACYQALAELEELVGWEVTFPRTGAALVSLTPIFASRVRCASRLQPESQISYAPSGLDEHGCWFWGAISLFRPQIFRGEGLEARWETC